MVSKKIFWIIFAVLIVIFIISFFVEGDSEILMFLSCFYLLQAYNAGKSPRTSSDNTKWWFHRIGHWKGYRNLSIGLSIFFLALGLFKWFC